MTNGVINMQDFNKIGFEYTNISDKIRAGQIKYKRIRFTLLKHNLARS